MASDATKTVEGAQETYFSITDRVPEETWYWAAIGSILLSAGLKVARKDTWALFVGQWPSTFLILAIFHKVLRPNR